MSWYRQLWMVVAILLAIATMGPSFAAPPQASVEWLLPATATHPVQTRVQNEASARAGRPLPTSEVLQPTLDTALPLFVPHHGIGLRGTITVAASDILPGLVKAWVHGFKKFYPNVHVAFGPPYEGSLAARELINGKINIAFVSRELKPTDVSAFRERYHYPPLSVPVSGGSYRHFGFLDAVVFFVNRQNPVAHLSLAQLDAVFSRSLLRGDRSAVTWGELGATGAWAKRPIHAYAIKPWNGFEEFVRQRVLDVAGRRGHWRTDLHFAPTVFPLAKSVAADPDGIGYAGLAFVDAPVKILAIGRDAHYIDPTYTNVALATYPLSRLIYANLNLKPGQALAPPLAEFLRFILSRQGQQIVLDQGVFLPLRAFQASRVPSRIGASAGNEP
ncbi:MAG: PstS family phosphate ABC transporter substrate-binding protein [Rhodanobacteraceae bacterium]